MKVAVVGGGISGISAACHLEEHCSVTLFESASKLGGHADTQTIEVNGKLIDVDTGFIVFNPDNYPTFMNLLKKYQVEYKDSDMSFGVTNRITGLEYNASSIDQLFCQRRNILNPKFYKMIYEIFRFYKALKKLINTQDEISLGLFLENGNYSNNFIDNHIIPMTCALWSGDTTKIMNFPARFLAEFMNNHKMLQAFNRPIWKTVTGGSRQYIEKIVQNSKFEIRTGAKITQIQRNDSGVTLMVSREELEFDKVIIATHSDQAIKLLDSPSKDETEILGGIGYQENTILLHRDQKVLPYNKKAWASWSVLVDEKSSETCRVSYYMNLLQSIDCETPIIVSLNMEEMIDTDKVWKKIHYSHPIYNQKTIELQRKKVIIQGKNNTYYCGAYWGWGFHEDGARSGLEAAKGLLKDSQSA